MMMMMMMMIVVVVVVVVVVAAAAAAAAADKLEKAIYTNGKDLANKNVLSCSSGVFSY